MTNFLKNWKIHEIVTLVMLSVVLAILWFGFSYLTPLMRPLKSVGLNYLMSGFWFMGGVLIPFLVRRPGAALIGETLAAMIEGFITQWGIMTLCWGIVQGLGAELAFFIFRYKRYHLFTLMLAGMLSGLFAWTFDFFYHQYWTLTPWLWGIQLFSILTSGAIFAGLLSYQLGSVLMKTSLTGHLTPSTPYRTEIATQSFSSFDKENKAQNLSTDE